jgi:hypothetical protein
VRVGRAPPLLPTSGWSHYYVNLCYVRNLHCRRIWIPGLHQFNRCGRILYGFSGATIYRHRSSYSRGFLHVGGSCLRGTNTLFLRGSVLSGVGCRPHTRQEVFRRKHLLTPCALPRPAGSSLRFTKSADLGLILLRRLYNGLNHYALS